MSSEADATRSQAPGIIESQPISTIVAPGETFVEEPEQYSIEHAIGAGGMGTVLAAKASRLGRSVALKIVTVDREDLRRRFEREAQVTARLQHPAIVPVYGSGRRAGQPFYAMKHVTGEPLDALIARTTSLAERIALLPKVIAVADAIAYAHSESVIHRDLKPANILVGNFGETVVIDWGLAKDLRSNDEGDTVSPYRASGDETGHGKVMGTPAYMPLEQARGEPVDERADVYALGAILYHVLMGRAPHKREAEDSIPWEVMLARVLASTPAPLPDGVPPDLTAIVTRAMARDAKDRYPSARELAEDLRRFQTGQLVGAHRYSRWQLVLRWLRRNKTPVAVAAVALVVLAVGAILATRRIIHERDTANQQRALAEARRVDAEQRKAEADARSVAGEKLIAFMLSTLHDRLVTVGRLDALQGVSDSVVAYYDSIAKVANEESRETLVQRGDAISMLAGIESAKGNLDAAERAVRSSMNLYERALARDPGAPEVDLALSTSRMQLSDIAQTRGNLTLAVDENRKAIEIRTRLVAQHPDKMLWTQMLARAHGNLGLLLMRSGKLEDALASHREALRIRLDVVAKGAARNGGSTDDMALGDLSNSYRQIGTVLQEQGKFDEAAASFQKCLELRSRVVEKDPNNFDLLPNFADIHNQLGSLELARGRNEAALPYFREQAKILEQLAKHDPANAGWVMSTVEATDNIGNVLVQLNRPSEALAEYQHGLATRRALCVKDPSNAQWQFNLGVSLLEVAYVEARDDRPASALTYLLEAKDLFAKLDPDVAGWQTGHAMVFERLGQVYAALGRKDDEVASYQAEVDIIKRLHDREPDSANTTLNLSWAYDSLAIAEDATGKHDDALAAREVSLAMREKLHAKDPDNITVYRAVGLGEMAMANALNKLERRAEAADHAKKAVSVFDTLTRKNAANPMYAIDTADACHSLAQALQALDPRAALAAGQRSLSLLEGLAKKGQLDPLQSKEIADVRRTLSHIKVRGG